MFRRRRPFKGFQVGVYLIGYGLIRFLIEYARQPDQGHRFPIKLVNVDNPGYRFVTPWNFTTGQILCALMIAARRRVPGRVSSRAAARQPARAGRGRRRSRERLPQAAQRPPLRKRLAK